MSLEEKEPKDGVARDWQVGEVLFDRYTVTAKVGEGGMGTVYKVHDSWENRALAMKRPRPELFSRGNGKQDFVREAETWVQLQPHPHIVSCVFVRMYDSIPCIFLEYIAGGSLAEWIRDRKLYEGGHQRALERILDVAIQCAWGLHAAHEQGLIHQDVKPANVLMTIDGVARVTDFGLAKARALTGEQEGWGSGQSLLVSSGGMTPAYCSPEQAAHRPVNRKTDIWSWGVSVLQMFVGEVTWHVGTVAHAVLIAHMKQSPAIPAIPKEVAQVLEACFQRQPEDRPTTLLQVADNLQVSYRRLCAHPHPRVIPQQADVPGSQLVNQGLSLLELGRAKEALAVLEQAIRLEPTLAFAYHSKGVILNSLGRLEEALAAFEQAIRLNSTFAQAYYNQGNVLDELGQPEEALVAFEQAIRLQPTFAKAHLNKGWVLDNLGRPEEALAAFEQAIHLEPTKVSAYLNKGDILRRLGRLAEAEQAYQKARELRR